MCIGLFAKEKAEWSTDYSTETLSWFLSPHRDDFTFRTYLFGEFPEIIRSESWVKMEIDVFYKIKVEIRETCALLFVNEKLYASTVYSEDEVPN